MAVVMMGGDDKKPIFHDFLAMSCGNSPATVNAAAAATAELATTSAMETEASASASAMAGVSSIGRGLISGSGDPVCGRHAVNNSDVFLIHGRKDDSAGPEASITFSGRKRSNSDSAYMGFINDKIRPACADTSECLRSLKMLGKEVISDQSGKYQEDEVQFPMQPPLRPTSLNSPFSSRPVLLASKWDRSIPMNPGSMVHNPSRTAQSGLFSSSYVSKDANVSAILMSQPAADEGSRTGIKGSGVVNVVTSSSGPGERSIDRVLPYSIRPTSTQINEPESSNALRYRMQNVGRQMTIFYAGQAHVFDEVHPNKAEVIMALAGSTGGSWSTTYLQKPAMCPSAGEVKVPSEEIQRQISSVPSSIQGNTEHAFSQVGKTTSLLTAGGQRSGRVVRYGRLATQAPLPSTEVKRDAS